MSSGLCLFGDAESIELQSTGNNDQGHDKTGFSTTQEKSRAHRAVTSSHEEFSYQQKTEELEEMNKNLLLVKEQLKENILKAHLLQVDLTTQFNPETTDRLRNTTTIMEKCKTLMNDTVPPATGN